MKTYHKFLLLILLSVFSSVAFAQVKEQAKTLVTEGIALHDAGKYDEAIAKYKEAMKIDPDYSNAYHEISFTLFSSGKGMEAIPYLEKLLKLDPSSGAAYDMLGSIYDDNKQVDKAIEYYKKGLTIAPGYQRLHYNLAITYLREKKYPEAEAYAIEAIKLDPKHASSQRTYALAVLGQNKRLCSLMAFCSFLLLEPQTKRSAEAYDYIDKIFAAGADQKEIVITTDKNTKDITPMSFAESSIVMAASASKALEKVGAGSTQERLTNELKMVFTTTSKESAKVATKDFFWKYYADYFGKLAETDNMEAFARLISLSAYKDENLQWFKDNNAKLSALDAWATATKREF
ncbi:tetratricopeptide repeat protein [Mucilaginibacter dorajii]|uniref:Tetratricopeptide repeat protein n=1 Tax=Mucilaginibacter dorajii TaxID=692994 RepID=A0ABP7Q161_9SPHI|nr:tetratricopeptide repeat protein [Mucilaginibacter dorajii]MCS3732897.1 Tfp pilus assembly protein PilF [Mucilaginibacter dorajii]